MIKVKLISDKFDSETNEEATTTINETHTRDLLPKLGKIYTVSGFVYKENYEGYKLEEIDEQLKGFNFGLSFSKKYFEKVSEDYTPNCLTEDGGLAQQYKIYIDWKFLTGSIFDKSDEDNNS